MYYRMLKKAVEKTSLQATVKRRCRRDIARRL